MEQSTFPAPDPAGLHVAIIMDGNGRWAQARGRRREWGHRRGAQAVRRVVEAAPGLGIRTLTLYAFSADNWHRPAREVRLLMRLFERYLRKESAELARNGVALRAVGRRDRLAPSLVTELERAEAETAGGRRLALRLAVDYSSRQMLLSALRCLALAPGAAGGGPPTPPGAPPGPGAPSAAEPGAARSDVSALLGEAMHAEGPSPDVDLLIRTGGERRLSDFLLWECAYAELLFTPVMWPDYDGSHLAAALADFRARERRFGRVAMAG